MKNVFALVGSRSFKKTTYKFVEDIILHINKIEKINYQIKSINELDIDPCTGCSSCFKLGHCRLNDGLSLLQEKILSADLFIISAPVYMHGMPGEMKNIIDRLATWAHTLRLAGKDILIVSTCDSNGHTTVVDDLHLNMLHMGGRVIGKYVGTKYIPDGLASDSEIMLLDNAKELLPSIVNKTLENWKSELSSNKFNESLFGTYRRNQKMLLDMGESTGETEYWIKSGMINCENYQDYLNTLSRKEIATNG